MPLPFSARCLQCWRGFLCAQLDNSSSHVLRAERRLAGSTKPRSNTPAVVIMFLFYPLFGVVAYGCELMAPTKWKGVLSIGGIRSTCAARLKLLLWIHVGLTVFIMYYSWWSGMLTLLVCSVCYYGFTSAWGSRGWACVSFSRFMFRDHCNAESSAVRLPPQHRPGRMATRDSLQSISYMIWCGSS